MTSTASPEDTVYAAIELSKESRVVGIAHPDRDKPSIYRIGGGDLGALCARFRKAARGRRIVVCYEAGYDGFWLARALGARGIDCRVLDPASMQVNRRARRVKTDRIDTLALLRAVRGVGGASAAILAREVFARSFPNQRHLSSYLGLTPSAYDSGTMARCQGISKAGNSWARRVLIEIAWLWRQYQPASSLSRWYAAKVAGQASARTRRIMLVALARKLAVALWRYVETGVVPEGAFLAPTPPAPPWP